MDSLDRRSNKLWSVSALVLLAFIFQFLSVVLWVWLMAIYVPFAQIAEGINRELKLTKDSGKRRKEKKKKIRRRRKKRDNSEVINEN